MARIGFDLGYPTVADALAGGEVGAFAALSSRGLGVPAVGKVLGVNLIAAVNTEYALNFPQVAGARLVATVAQLVIPAITGTAAGNLTFNLGNANGQGGAPKANVAVCTITATNINAAAGLVPFRVPVPAIAASVGGPIPDMTTDPIVLKLASLPTGLTVLTGDLYVAALYV